MGDVNRFQVGAHSEDRRLANGLPLIVGEEVPVLVPDSARHRRSRFVPGGYPHGRVALAFREGPKDRLGIVGRAVGRTGLRERERWPASRGPLGGRVAWA
jgi:hypothetical protein